MSMCPRTVVSALVMLVTTGTLGAAPPVPAPGPATPRIPVEDVYHGVVVTDDYRWLEDGSDPDVRAWSAGQNEHARAMLDDLPRGDEIRARITDILAAPTVSWWSVVVRPGATFAMERRPPKEQPFLVVMPSADEPDAARVLVDPNELDEGGSTSIDWFVPSPDGRLVAVSLSQGGTESGDVHVIDVASGERRHEVIPRVNGGTAGGDLAWAPDGASFFYTRYPRAGERPDADLDFYQQLYHHVLGTPASEDTYELGAGLPRIAEIQLAMDHASGRLLATVQKGDGGEFAHFLRAPDGDWRQFSRFGDGVLQATFGKRDDLYVLSRAGAPRGCVRRVPIATLAVADAPVVVPEGEDAIVEDFWGPPTVLVTGDRLYVTYQLGGPSTVRAFDLDGAPVPGPATLPVSAVGSLVPLGGGSILFRNGSFLAPSAYFRFDRATGETHRTALATTSPVSFPDAEVVREFAVSKDGTRVPVNIIIPRGIERDGSHPCVVTGYGGYGVNIEPRFRPLNRVLLDHGVIYAVANLRGGGEYGEAWHRGGNLTNKQNVFDDFTAVLRHLVERGYTSSDRLAMMGGSNGGLLMGAVMTQHPGLVKTVVSHVGIYDMLRVERSPNGAFNIPEFGTVESSAHFAAMRAYSPYHNVRDGVAYPATLFLTGANDPRVDPMQSRKMTARLQAANAADTPILLRTSAGTGHGGDTALSERIEESVDVYSFLFDQLGVGGGGRH